MRCVLRVPMVRVPRWAPLEVLSTAASWDSLASAVKLEMGMKYLGWSQSSGGLLERAGAAK